MQIRLPSPPEFLIAGAALTIMALFTVFLGLPVVFPSGERAAFVGIHYIYPLAGVAACMAIGKFLIFYIPCERNFYMVLFIILFYCSFCYHAIKTPDVFGRLLISVLLLQTFGSVAYLIAPAAGPFIYESGVDPLIAEGQAGMLKFYRASLANGPQWLAIHGGVNFTAGLAAMPSLHTAGAFLFFLFAWKHGRPLLPLYTLILFYIMVMAVASRWHYLIDLPVGVLLAWGSYKLACYLDHNPLKSASLVCQDVGKPVIV